MESPQRMTAKQEQRAFDVARLIAATGAAKGRCTRARIKAVVPWTASQWNAESFRYCVRWIELLEFNRN